MDSENQILVTVLLVNWNGIKYIQDFFPKLFLSDSSKFHILMVDNHSSDNSVAYVRENYPQVEILCLEKNYGFAEGNNRAIPYIKTPYVLLLNTDVEVTANWLNPLVNELNSNHKIAAVQPKIKSFHQKTHFEYAGAAGGFVDILAYPLCRGRILNITEQDNGQYEDRKEIFWSSGACMLVRTSVIQEIGLFDSALFAHMEEIDFCWRAQNAGYQITYRSDSVVYHVGGGTLAHGSPRKIFLNIRNSLVVMAKNLNLSEAIVKIFLRLCLDGVAAIRGIFTGEFQLLWLVLKGHFAFYAMLPHAFQQKKSLPKPKKFSELKGIVNHLMVWKFFIKKKQTFSEPNQN